MGDGISPGSGASGGLNFNMAMIPLVYFIHRISQVVVGLGVFRPDADRYVKAVEGTLDGPSQEERGSEIVVGFGKLRLKLHRRAQTPVRVAELGRWISRRDAQIEMEFCVARFKPNGLAVGGGCRFILILRLQRVSEIVMGRRECWVKLDRATKGVDRREQVALFDQDHSQQIVIDVSAGAYGYGPVQEIGSRRIAALLMQKKTKELQSIGVVRILPQNLAIRFLRLIEPAGAMEVHRGLNLILICR